MYLLFIAMRSLSKIVTRLVIILAFTIAVSLASLFVAPSSFQPAQVTTSTLLAEADRFAWLENWYKAGPLYRRAEDLFRASGDRRGELHALIGRLRSETETTSLDDTVERLGGLLNDPVVSSDPGLRLWCLTAKAYAEFDDDIAASKQDWQEALALANTLGDSKWASRARGELGVIAFTEGHLSTAVSLVGKALISSYQTKDVAAQVDFFSLIGAGLNEQLRYSEALAFFEQAIRVAEKNKDAGFPYLAYEGKVSAFLGLNRQSEARQVLETLLTKAREQNRRGEEAVGFILLGDLSIALKDTETAKTSYERAAHAFQELRINRGLDEAMFKLASIYRERGQFTLASQSVLIGLEAVRRDGGGYYLPRALSALAELEAAQNRYREADQQFREAEERLEWVLNGLRSDKEIAAIAGTMSDTYTHHFRLLAERKDVGRAFQVLERIRGLSAEGVLHPLIETRKESSWAPALNAAIGNVQLELLTRDHSSQESPLYDQLHLYENALAFVTNDAHEKRLPAAVPVSLRSVQAALGPAEVLLEYVLDEPRSFCIVVTHNDAQIATLSAGRAQIAALAESYLAEARALRAGGQFATKLYDVLLDPVPEISRRSHLIISPDGILHSVPYEALRDPRGLALVQSKFVSYTPSGTVFLRLRRAPRSRAQRPVLAIGGVDYRFVRSLTVSDSRAPLSDNFPKRTAEVSKSTDWDLPTSREEALSVVEKMGTGSEALLGSKATETAFKSSPLKNFRILHLAVHAVADAEYPDRAALVLGLDPHTTDDGLLQVREIAGLSLDADLVTLSACETGVGRLEGEAGVLSLERGFLVAGARAVVASLWDVEDHSTNLLMQDFYSHLAKGEEKAVALSRAKRDLIARYPDIPPYYWAGFVLVGEGARPIVSNPQQ